MHKPRYTILFHNYYGDDRNWISYFNSQATAAFDLFYNGVSGSYHRLKAYEDLKKFDGQITKLHAIISPNKGKDIGGKLALLDAYLRSGQQSDYLLLLHDKRSPYQSSGASWREQLFRIAKKELQQQVFESFAHDPSVGIIASKNMIRNEADNEQQRDAYTDSEFISALKKKYAIEPPHLAYVAGTMFWVRASLFVNFFRRHAPLDIRSTLEDGNVTDENPTITHAWERLLCWIVTAQGYKIKGV